VDHLKQLNQGNNAEEVVRLFESGRIAFTQDALGEYIKALARMDRLDNTRLMGLLQVCRGLMLHACEPASPIWAPNLLWAFFYDFQDAQQQT